MPLVNTHATASQIISVPHAPQNVLNDFAFSDMARHYSYKNVAAGGWPRIPGVRRAPLKLISKENFL